MIVSELRVHAFRNLVDQRVALQPGINVFSGANGQGKTNLLEAVFFLGLLRSFRTTRISHLVQWDAEACAVDGTLTDGDGGVLAIGVRHGARRRLLRAGQPIERASDYLGSLHCVPVAPEDLQLAKGPARGRRQFMDVTLAPHDPACLAALQRFNAALTQRNVLLRSPQPDESAIAAFDGVLLSAGTEVVCRRWRFIVALRAAFRALLAGLNDDGLDVDLGYQPGFSVDPSGTPESVTAAYRAALEKSAERDRRYGQSHVGPQRDDLRLTLAGRPLADVGSEGQCRLTAILLRLAAAKVLTDEDDPPIVLVDDVIGELDAGRRAYFMDLLASFPQVLLACTDAAELPTSADCTRFYVRDGKITARP